MNSKKNPAAINKRKKKDQNMQKTYKFIAMVGAFVLLCGITATVWVIVAGIVALGPTPGFYPDGKKIEENPGTAITVDGTKLTIQQYRYFYLQTKYSMDFGKEEYWEEDEKGEKAAELKEATENIIREYYAWLNIAKDNGLTLSAAEENGVLKNLELDKKEYGTEFKMFLKKQFFADEETYIYFRTNDLLVEKAKADFQNILNKQAEDDTADIAAFSEKVLTVKHILLAFTVEGSADDAETQKAAQLKLAQQLAAQLRAAEGDARNTLFEELRAEHNTDPGAAAEGASYTFGPGTMVQVFYDGSAGLQIGEVSDPVESDFGYHVIYRVPLDEASAPNEENIETFKTAYTSYLNSTALEKHKEAVVLSFGSYYDKISPKTVK